MNNYAIIDNNIVTNILEVEDENTLPICKQIVKLPKDHNVSIGDFYIDNKFQLNLTGNQQIEYLKLIILSNYQQIQELSQRIYQLEKQFFLS